MHRLTPSPAHPAACLFPTIVGAHWAAMFRRAKAYRNAVSDGIRRKLSLGTIKLLRRDGL